MARLSKNFDGVSVGARAPCAPPLAAPLRHRRSAPILYTTIGLEVWKISLHSSCVRWSTPDWTTVMLFLPTLRSHYWLLQSVLHSAARAVLRCPRRAGLTQLIRERLHWLPVPERITFKLATLVYKCISGQAPDYLAGMCTGVESVEAWARLRSAAAGKLLQPTTDTVTVVRHGFYYAGPAVTGTFAQELSLPGTKVPGTFAPENFRSLELLLPGAKVPGTFASWNLRSLELALPG